MTNKACLLFAVIVAVCGVAHSQTPHFGKCLNVTVAENFNVDAYMGVWYEYERTFAIFEINTKCNYANYEKINSTSISVLNASVRKFNQTPSNITGIATVISNGKLAVSFRDQRNQAEKPNYLVLGTDYRTYAVVYSCTDRMFGHTDFIWVLTRERKPDDSVIMKARKIIEDNKLSTGSLWKTSQELCPDEMK